MSEAPVPAPIYKKEIDPNPLPYLTEGIRQVWRTNVKSFFILLGAMLAAPLLLIVLSAVLLGNAHTTNELFDLLRSNIWALGLVVVAVVIFMGVAGTALDHIILLGSRTEKVGANSALSFAFRRFLPIIGINFLVFVFIIIPWAIVIALMLAVTPFFGLLILPLIVILVVTAFFVTPLRFILVDTPKLLGISTVVKRLFGLWKKGFAALLVYILCMSVLSGVAGGAPSGSTPFTPSNTQQSSSTQSSGETSSELRNTNYEISQVVPWLVSIGGIVFLVIMAFSIIIDSLLAAGFARLYNVITDNVKPLEPPKQPSHLL